MGRGGKLTKDEQSRISALSAAEAPQTEISAITGRSRHVKRKFLLDPKGYEKKKPRIDVSKLTAKDRRLILRSASAGAASSSQLKTDLSLSVSPRRVRQILSDSGRFSYRRRKATLPLTEAHKKARMKFAEENCS